ncbi:hypothetical protein TanjilG_04041 [Lupinus angustifolius]|uniref:SMP domain-containing protein n=2 Tax=Lupinus angustifolius TaxID=3871 RepID=A0A4P1RBU7_LUPAN|nr:hypothetical protein TanjilG_04041 [Lupinus angustifolius]
MRPQDPIKYGDVFHVSGDLAQKPIAPEHAKKMQSAETHILGKTVPAGVAASMQSAATINQRDGLLGNRDVTYNPGVTATQTHLPGRRIITESVAGQVVGQYVEATSQEEEEEDESNKITIGEAMEGTAHTVGEKAVEESDAAAIQAAEVRATRNHVIKAGGGVGASAESAAAYNTQCKRDEDKIKMRDIVSDAKTKLGEDKVATGEDAVCVTGAELRNNNTLTPAGLSASIAAAANLNQTLNS